MGEGMVAVNLNEDFAKVSDLSLPSQYLIDVS